LLSIAVVAKLTRRSSSSLLTEVGDMSDRSTINDEEVGGEEEVKEEDALVDSILHGVEI
jgi:hypothetical protein